MRLSLPFASPRAPRFAPSYESTQGESALLQWVRPRPFEGRRPGSSSGASAVAAGPTARGEAAR